MGDGNINFVFIVEGPSGALCIKQALPFVRCVGESWPLSQNRLRVEAAALEEHYKYCPEHTPGVFQYDAALSLVAMAYVAPPSIILRKGLIQVGDRPLEALVPDTGCWGISSACFLFENEVHCTLEN